MHSAELSPRYFLLFLVALLLGSAAIPLDAEAQIWRRAKERAQERLQQKAEERVDRAVDAAVDRAWEGAEARVAGAAAAAAGSAAARATDVSAPEALDLGPIATSPADATAVTYRETTVTEMPALGAFASFAGDEPPEITTVTLTAAGARYDSGDSATLIDADAGTITLIDHEARSYSTMTPQSLRGEVAAAQSEARAAGDYSAHSAPGGVRYDMAVSAETTGRSETIRGARASQHIVVIETQIDATGTQETDPDAARANIVTLIETWTAENVAGTATMQAFGERMAAQFGNAAAETMQGTGQDYGALAGLGMQPEDAEAAFAATAEALEDVDGFPIRTTVHMVLVPDGAAFDAEAVLQGDESTGGLAALAGRSGESASAQQMVLFRTTTHVSDLRTVAPETLDLSVPQEYRAANWR